MKLSAKSEYACLAVLELTLRHGQTEPVRLTEIAGSNGIPERFLVQILIQLKGTGVVQSVRGASGGYRLAVSPHEISLWDVVQSVEAPPETAVAKDSCSHTAGWQVLLEVWQEVTRLEQDYLSNISFAQLAEQAREQNSNMYYI